MPATTEANPAIVGVGTIRADDSPGDTELVLEVGAVCAGDPVEMALADALSRAAAAGAWSAVEVLARELGARREAHAGVVRLHEERARRRGAR